MLDGVIRFSEHKQSFYDEFGNRINNYIVEKYGKSSSGVWNLEETIKTNAGSYFVVNDKFYFSGNNDSLIPLNMDFNSKDCHACYKVVGEDTEEYQKITFNEYLCENKYLKLHKQNYSDGTCFYTLEDNKGNFRVNYGNSDLVELVNVLERTIEINKGYLDRCPHLKEDIEQTEKLISDIKQLNVA